jgi:hypothetical protein
MFAEINEKAIESMNKDEPEVSLEFLKKIKDLFTKNEKNNNTINKDNSN